MSETPQDRDTDPTGAEREPLEDTGAGRARAERPGDAARRALRAARAAHEAEEARRSSESPQTRALRPGDAARAALRRAVGARRAAGEPLDDETSVTDAPAHTTDTAAPDTPNTAGPTATSAAGNTTDSAREESAADAASPRPSGPETPRPADVARDALRAARREQERERERAAAAREAARASRPGAGTRPSRPAPSPGAAATREMAAFLANAFRLPAGTDDRAETDSTAPPREGQPAQPAQPAPPSSSEDTSEAGARPAASAHPPASQRPTASVRPPASARPMASARPTAPAHPPASPRPLASARPPASPRPTDSRPTDSRPLASPHRDSDLRRTFPAFPARRSGDGARFAETWWGNAWITALEEGALDADRLARGRGYAEQGHVDAITVTPGLVLAYVHGSRPRPYRVQIRLRTLDDADWERFLDAAADRPGHIAALLDKEMPHALAEGDVPLLPGPGDLEPRCSCPDRGHPCKHAAALCYQTARLLDADPFVLLLLRGRGERELIDALSRLNATRAARAARERDPAPLPGVRATDALAPRPLPPLPPPLPVPAHPEQPPAYPAAPGGPDPLALDQLATDAAARAHTLLTTGRDPVAELTLWQDAVRLAAARPGAGLTAATRGLYASLAAAAGRTPAELARAVAAWRQGGPDGLAALEEPWDPPAGRFDRARPLLLAADLPAFRPWRNRLTHPRGHIQLRLGRDGLWYAYESEPGADDWWPRGTPDPDPVGALTGLGAPADP
ncbi:SWIM zinc finger family protein [Streptomyces sp. NPDC052687]|uniref:SWIM zinc finger family protein n=1 Tax=Streptomyces sp. NPDC052687 TaxID=3154759 RepID=UPI00341899D3